MLATRVALKSLCQPLFAKQSYNLLKISIGGGAYQTRTGHLLTASQTL